MASSSTVDSKYLKWIASMAMFMQSLDGTILNTALPSIAKYLNEDPLSMQSVIISYVLTLALLIPASGWLSNRFGTKNIFVTAVALFTLGSIACAVSTSLFELILSRVLQGIGGAIMVPVSRLTVFYTYSKKDYLKVINFILIPGLLGQVLGPLLGGLLIQISWHWIFLINIPIGIVGVIMASKYFPNYKRGDISPFDIIGMLLFGLGLVCISFSTEAIQHPILDNKYVLAIFISGFLLLVFYALRSRKFKYPLVDLKLLKIRTFRVGVFGNLLTRLGIGGLPLTLPLMLQEGLGYSPFTAGIFLATSALANMLGKSLVVRLVKKLGYKKVLQRNSIALGIILISFSLIGARNLPIYYFTPLFLVYGFVSSIQMSSMNTISLADLRENQGSSGNTILAIVQQLSISFGVSISMLILYLFRHNEAFSLINAFRYTFISLGVITLLASSIFLLLKNSDGAEMSGNKV